MSRRASYFLNGVSLASLGFSPTPDRTTRRDGLSVSVQGLKVPGMAGELDVGAARQAEPRTIEITGDVRGTSRSDCLDKIRTILAHAGRGLVELRAVDATDRVILVERDGAAQAGLYVPTLLETDAANRSGSLTLRFRAAEPAWRDREPQLLAIGQVAVPLPLGYELGSSWTLEIFGSEAGAVTNPQVLYEDAGGNAIASLTLTGSLDWGSDGTAKYALSTEGVAPRIRKMVSSSWTDAESHLTAGGFFHLNPIDGFPPSAIYPTLRLFDASARATGLLTYFRRHSL
jgi:hypothetical protein